MLFNSLEFGIFLPVVFILYWSLSKAGVKVQNLLLLCASYYFYACWDWRFLSLIIFSTLTDYLVGRCLSKTKDQLERRLFLLVSITVNIGFLAFFKYFNFFSESFSKAFTFIGMPIVDPALLDIILPVGISFYTFQTLSYSIDVYRYKVEPTRDIIAFFAFVSFFPQLVAGPIERATNLLPQFLSKRHFDYDIAVDGIRQILWGLFKKVVIADTCAIYVNDIFGNYGDYSGSTLMAGAFFFSIQIYGDFSGYSDIAIGTSRLFGFNLMRNFAYPYFSRDIAEFWRRWHISLSSWFRDYVYIPMGGSRGNAWNKVRNTLVIFILCGFWHGANWTFMLWGALNALFFLPLILRNKNRVNLDIVAQGKLLPNAKEIYQIVSTFILTMFAWIFFRSVSIYEAFGYVNGILSWSFFSVPEVGSIYFVVILVLFILVEWVQRDKLHAFQFSGISIRSRCFRWVAYLLLISFIYYSGNWDNQAFIYFQF